MNRQIKFRVWNSNAKDWIHDESLSEIGKFGPLNTLTNSFSGEGLVFQEFINALDKKNRQIFEGDIVLFDNPDPYDGQDQLTKIVGYNPRVMGFRLYNFIHEINKYGGTAFFPEQVEVIGNIFEGAIKDGVDYGLYLKET